MRRRLLACIASAVLLPAVAAGSAAADDPSVQAVGQQAGSQQSAGSSATSTQYQPSNTNISVRIGSPGDGGAVTQTNASAAASAALNANAATQQAAQAAGGAGVQSADQSAANKQAAGSAASSAQYQPQNKNIAVRIMSPGDDGSVTQTNSSAAKSVAANHNEADQSAGQSGGASAGVQNAQQQASNDQGAGSKATSEQKHPSNVNIPVRIYSPGDGGSVTQTNSSSAASAAVNHNATSQGADQASAPSRAPVRDACGGRCGDPGHGVQDAEQYASNDQSAHSSAHSTQDHPSNVNAPVRIHSPGDDGAVKQSNSSSAGSLAHNLNATDQSADQSAAGTGGVKVQASDQKAKSDQHAGSHANSEQDAPSNVNEPVRIKSPNEVKGERVKKGERVDQSNSSDSKSAAGNANLTAQHADQVAAPGDVEVQAAGQFATNDQRGHSSADSTQKDACNDNEPVRIHSPGDDGSVGQTNSSSAKSLAGNLNVTRQEADQAPNIWPGTLVEAIGQKAGNDQHAWSKGSSEQDGASNANGPVRIKSDGGGGSVAQANASLAASLAGNANVTCQRAAQGDVKPSRCWRKER